MKKLIALMLVLVLALSLAACGSKEEVKEEATEEIVEEVTEETVEELEEGETFEEIMEDEEIVVVLPDEELDDQGNAVDAERTEESAAVSALQILENIWAQYADDEKFAIMGGNPEAGVMDAPGVYDMAYAENLSYNLLIPAEQLANVAEAATMIHMMNANTFTGGVVRLKEGTDVAAFAAAMRDAIQGNQWMCGFPETLIVADMGGNCVLIAFGVNDAMTPFRANMAEAYPYCVELYNEAIAG